MWVSCALHLHASIVSRKWKWTIIHIMESGFVKSEQVNKYFMTWTWPEIFPGSQSVSQ